ncbi:hypothetical protein GGI04_003268 [Coemansia thaxteri]|nr:hypothetical protein GGI04_003268 [Coemansia thaxteri]
MAIFALLRRLVSGEDVAAATPTEEAGGIREPPAPAAPPQPQQEKTTDTASAPKRPPLLPPPPPISGKPSAAASMVSMSGSVRSQGDSERPSAASSSSYRDFTGGGHADGGHWNDPPPVVFRGAPGAATPSAKKNASGAASAASPDPSTDASSFQLVDALPEVPDARADQELMISQGLRRALERVPVDAAAPPVARRMAEDTRRRMDELELRLPALSADLVHAICAIAVLVDRGLLADAQAANLALMHAGHDAELRWLVAIKRIIDMLEKEAQSVTAAATVS